MHFFSASRSVPPVVQAQIAGLGLSKVTNYVAVRPADSAQKVGLPPDLHPVLREALQGLGYQSLYSHQVRAFTAATGGEDVVLTTPTASGKSLAFLLPVMQAVLEGETGAHRGLYLAPTKALIADQSQKLRSWLQALAIAGADVRASTLTGDTAGDRALLFQPSPQVLLTNPDCLNALLYKGNYSQFRGLRLFLKQLRYVVLDEVQVYAGLFGCNVANLIRRLLLAVSRAGGRADQVQFILASATVANPGEVWQTLCSRDADHPVMLIDQSGAAFPGRTEVYTTGLGRAGVCRLLNALAGQGLVTLLFVDSRRLGRELTQTLMREQRRLGRPSGGVAMFHGTLSQEKRREVAQRIQQGRLKVLVATSALEQGVDFPQIDAAVCWGFPGINQLRQRFGRAGRGQTPGLGIFVPTFDRSADRYYALRGRELAEAEPATVLLNPDYLPRLKHHVLAAAGESGVEVRQELYPYFRIAGLKAAQILLDQGHAWVNRHSNRLQADLKSALRIQMRGSLIRQVRLVDAETDEVLEEFSQSLALRELYPGAIYSEVGEEGIRKWRIGTLNLEEATAWASPINPDSAFSTKANLELRVLPDSTVVAEQRPIQYSLGNGRQGQLLLELRWGTVFNSVVGYDERLTTTRVACFREGCAAYRQKLPQRAGNCAHCGGTLLLAESAVETVSQTWFEQPLVNSYQTPILTIACDPEMGLLLNQIANRLLDELQQTNGEVPEEHQDLVVMPPEVLGLHSLSHLLLNSLPLASQPIGASDLVDHGRVLLFDDAPEGTGTVEYLYHNLEALLPLAYHLVAECDCQMGCPKCCQTHHCGVNNEAVHRLLGWRLLEQLNQS